MNLTLNSATQETILRSSFWETRSCIDAYLAEKFSAFYGKRILNMVLASNQPQSLDYVWERSDSHSDDDKESSCLVMTPCGFVNTYERFAYAFLPSSSCWSRKNSAWIMFHQIVISASTELFALSHGSVICYLTSNAEVFQVCFLRNISQQDSF